MGKVKSRRLTKNYSDNIPNRLKPKPESEDYDWQPDPVWRREPVRSEDYGRLLDPSNPPLKSESERLPNKSIYLWSHKKRQAFKAYFKREQALAGRLQTWTQEKGIVIG